MEKKKKGFMLSLVVIVSTFMVLSAQAQGGPGGPGGDPDPTKVPFDGGITLMIAASIGYAAKKGYDKRKKNLGDNFS